MKQTKGRTGDQANEKPGEEENRRQGAGFFPDAMS
jgi:hypothetical protein